MKRISTLNELVGRQAREPTPEQTSLSASTYARVAAGKACGQRAMRVQEGQG